MQLLRVKLRMQCNILPCWHDICSCCELLRCSPDACYRALLFEDAAALSREMQEQQHGSFQSVTTAITYSLSFRKSGNSTQSTNRCFKLRLGCAAFPLRLLGTPVPTACTAASWMVLSACDRRRTPVTDIWSVKASRTHPDEHAKNVRNDDGGRERQLDGNTTQPPKEAATSTDIIL